MFSLDSDLATLAGNYVRQRMPQKKKKKEKLTSMNLKVVAHF